ncbi:MAG: M48 family metalloprotease, partial [Candidatus Omnitrophica bacterium]|nr:M48 family metalloprotease [Candidatus Omnitrophota bacterium]
RDKILRLAREFNIKVLDVFEINFSAKTKKSNAAITGWGDTRRIILADNLVNEFTPEEVEVVVAHEMAHYKLKHIWKLIAISAASTAISLYILNLAAQGIASALGMEAVFDIALFPALSLVFTIYGIITAPIQNAVSRKLENDADALALKMTRLKGSFISLMERLAKVNLSDKEPNALIEFLFYDHPSIAKRIESAKRFSA